VAVDLFDAPKDKLVLDALDRFQGRTYESLERRRDGEPIPVEVTLTSIDREKGPVVRISRDVSQRKQAEEDLRSSEERFRSLVDNSVDGILLLDDAGFVIFANPSAERIMGRPLAKLLGREVGIPFIGDEPDEVEIVRPNGEAAVVEMRLVPFKWRGDRYHQATLRDVTLQKRVMEALRDSEKRYRSLFETMAQGVIYRDAQGGFTSANPAAERILGRTLDQLRGRVPNIEWRAIHEDGSECPPHEFASSEALRTGKPVRNKIMGLFNPTLGEYRWLMVNAIPEFRPDEDKPYRVFATFDDITELKRTEKLLKSSEERLRKLLDSIEAGILLIDPETKTILDANPVAARLIGLSREEVLGRNSAEFLNRVPSVEAPSGETGKNNPSVESSLLTAGGTELPIMETTAPLELEGRDVILDTFTDVSRLKALESQLQQALKMEAIGRLAGGVAHDFNNILTTIIGISSILMSDLPESDPLREDAREIKLAGEKAAALTRQLLAFSRKQMLEPKLIDLSDSVKGLEKMLGRLIGEDVELIVRYETESALVEVDPTQIEQVILNLAVNARDAMPEGGKLILEVSNVDLDQSHLESHPMMKPGSYAMLAVTDTGIGIDEKTREKIFEPFYTTKELGKGTGLGLATVYGIIKQSNGFIWVYSEPGQGTTFKIYLPRLDKNGLLHQNDKKVRTVPAGGGEVVLLVEDEMAVRRLARKILSRSGYKVFEISNAEAAMDLIDNQHVDLVITDVVLPGMSGSELARLIEKHRPDVKIVFMSGYTEHSSLEKGALNMEGRFLAKPFSPDSLLRMVKTVLSQ
jgi:PAS domain S-box-containing protein